MTAVRPPLDHATVESFLRQHLGAPIEELQSLRGGELCTVFSYTLAGEQYVIRFSAMESGFQHDRLAYERYAPSGIPIPRISAIGHCREWAFAIAPCVPGRTLQSLPAAQHEAAAPALVEMVDRIHQLDLSATSGYGAVDEAGVGRYPRWTAYLSAIGEEDPADFYGHWRRLYATSFLERALCEQLLTQMNALLPALPPVRALVHGDIGFDNVLVDGERISAVLDWDNMAYGDFLFDVAWLRFWPSPVPYAALFRRYYAGHGRDLPQYEERLRCYTCYIGLVALRFFAHTHQRAPYEWARERVRTLLGSAGAGDDERPGA